MLFGPIFINVLCYMYEATLLSFAAVNRANIVDVSVETLIYINLGTF